MKVKICGLNNQDNISQLLGTGLDFMGFIFYEKSKRSVPQGNLNEVFANSISEVKKVGVFVNDSLDAIMEATKNYQLDYVQLHGEESPAFCAKVKEGGSKVIKAISVSNELPIKDLESYEAFVDFFLFDTSGKDRGGNGTKFNWQILTKYKLETPFLLAGGISMEDAFEIKKMNINGLYGVDLNSKFELEPGVKDINKVKQFIEDIR